MADAPRFEFGRNWERFVERHFSEERVEDSKRHLLEFLKLSDLSGRHFLDVGCGSGLHSLAALRAGAARVTSFDYDPASVRTARKLHEREGAPAHWSIQQGSVLDREFLATLGQADLVYSWGVLHHTGDMATAIDNTRGLVAPGGLLYLALYDYDRVAAGPHSPEYWLDVKQMYTQAGWVERRLMEAHYVWDVEMKRRFKKWRKVRDKWRAARGRGMSYYTDLRDWIGGWPMEFVRVPDLVAECQAAGFESLDIRTGEANAEFLFHRQ